MLPAILIICACILAALATIYVGIAPVEDNYGKITKLRLLRLTCLYGVATILFLAVFLAFRAW
ncbi:hypothetical protein ACQCN2_13165 [Brevibacillus ginsengisoli]|uniref:hypothetical protein n=1 Tax=Brevibacillus ginsengisoli TaxID=363854 RepID=UPI003CF2E9B6